MSYGGGSGSGSSSIHASSDVALNNPTDTQVLSYSTSLAKWQNHSLAEADVTNLSSDLAARAQTVSGGLEVVLTVNASGSSYTVNAATANLFFITLSANCSFTLSGATTGKSCAITLALTQGSGGSKTVTWPGSVRWSGGTAPTLTTTAGKADFFSLLSVDGGTNWFGFISGTNY